MPSHIDTLSHDDAKKLMDSNFLGIEEVQQAFNMKFDEKQLNILSEIPFSKELIEECKNTHILTALCPLTLQTIIDKGEGAGIKIHWKGFPQYRVKAFNEVMKIKTLWGFGDHIASWALIPKKATMEKSKELLWRPNLSQELFAIIGQYINSGQDILKSDGGFVKIEEPVIEYEDNNRIDYSHPIITLDKEILISWHNIHSYTKDDLTRTNPNHYNDNFIMEHGFFFGYFPK